MADLERDSRTVDEQPACPPGRGAPEGELWLWEGGRRGGPHLDFPADPQLVALGWQRRFMADPIRAREATQLYTELGFDVHLEPIKPSELSEACGDCRLATCLAYVTVYTRKQLAQYQPSEDLEL